MSHHSKHDAHPTGVKNISAPFFLAARGAHYDSHSVLGRIVVLGRIMIPLLGRNSIRLCGQNSPMLPSGLGP
jgi:hypothetical protein